MTCRFPRGRQHAPAVYGLGLFPFLAHPATAPKTKSFDEGNRLMSLEQLIEQAVASAINRHLQPLVEKLNTTDARAIEDEYMNTSAAAQYLGISPITMSIWRVEGRGPEFVRVGGRSIRYRRSTLDSFVTANSGLIGKKGRPSSQLIQTVKTSGTSLGRLRKPKTAEMGVV